MSTHRPTRESVMQRLSEALLRRSLIKIDLSQRGLRPADARLVKMALLQNAQLSVLKLGYNNLGDDGAIILSAGIAQHHGLESLDLGFNNLGDEGCQAIACAVPSNGTLHTLYLAGNLIGQDGALSIADLIRRGSSLRRLYLTGNKLGTDGVKAIIDAIIQSERSHGDEEEEEKVADEDASNDSHSSNSRPGMQELFLGGTDMGPGGCSEIAQLLKQSSSLRVLSLPNCDFGDESIAQLAAGIKSNRENLPLESLQLSFNQLSCKGIEHLCNAIWGSRTVKELRLDNNKIGDLGAEHIAGVLPTLVTLETLDLGFNNIKTRGMVALMKTIADNSQISSLSVSGNNLDTNAAKAISYALAYNQTLTSLALVGCGIGEEGQRQVVAGAVSNAHTVLHELSGFAVGPVVVTLGFPGALEHWSNEQVFNFVHLMWAKTDAELVNEEEEKNMDPLSFLEGDGTIEKPAPVEASIVVEVAKKTFASLVEDGVDVFSRSLPDSSSPIAGDSIVFESRQNRSNNRIGSSLGSHKTNSFVAPPEEAKPATPDPSRKKRIVEWLCVNIVHLNKLAQLPFSSSELGRLHQHYFTPVVNESGGSVAPSPSPSVELTGLSISSVPGVSPTVTSDCPEETMSDVAGDTLLAVPSNHQQPSSGIASLPILKRKVSYRFLADASLASAPRLESRRKQSKLAGSVTMLIEGGPVGHSMPPKNKRARRNRTRISFLPRIKAKLDSHLDVCHEKALVTMRQLYFVEQAILSGQVNPIDPTKTARTHLCGEFASDAETIIVDMI